MVRQAIGEAPISLRITLPKGVPLDGREHGPKSRVTATKAALAGVHISTARTLAAGTTPAVTVRQVLDGFDEAQHGHAVKLLHGAVYGTTKTAAAQSFTTRSDGRIDYVASFEFSGSEIATYKIRTEMTISDPAVDYRVAERWDHAAA